MTWSVYGYNVYVNSMKMSVFTMCMSMPWNYVYNVWAYKRKCKRISSICSVSFSSFVTDKITFSSCQTKVSWFMTFWKLFIKSIWHRVRLQNSQITLLMQLMLMLTEIALQRVLYPSDLIKGVRRVGGLTSALIPQTLAGLLRASKRWRPHWSSPWASAPMDPAIQETRQVRERNLNSVWQ